ncbi:hypothetical protein RRG08_021244 [Elysia crispata]|uniref:Uncharacterized protein n=1 Tax=Elysia crispata TaxID=231223 RepID=A0AAE1D7K1_9GAST|nr:hypothetical protein RRG08_021244 [Elysia crispata]
MASKRSLFQITASVELQGLAQFGVGKLNAVLRSVALYAWRESGPSHTVQVRSSVTLPPLAASHLSPPPTLPIPFSPPLYTSYFTSLGRFPPVSTSNTPYFLLPFSPPLYTSYFTSLGRFPPVSTSSTPYFLLPFSPPLYTITLPPLAASHLSPPPTPPIPFSPPLYTSNLTSLGRLPPVSTSNTHYFLLSSSLHKLPYLPWPLPTCLHLQHPLFPSPLLFTQVTLPPLAASHLSPPPAPPISFSPPLYTSNLTSLGRFPPVSTSNIPYSLLPSSLHNNLTSLGRLPPVSTSNTPYSLLPSLLLFTQVTLPPLAVSHLSPPPTPTIPFSPPLYTSYFTFLGRLPPVSTSNTPYSLLPSLLLFTQVTLPPLAVSHLSPPPTAPIPFSPPLYTSYLTSLGRLPPVSISNSPYFLLPSSLHK